MTHSSEPKDKISTKRTYLLLQQALFRLLMEMPFEKITLTQICEYSLVPRSTFYRYFEDKYDLLSYSLQTFFETTQLDEDVIYLTNIEAARSYLTKIIDLMDKNKTAFHKLYVMNKGGIFMDILRDFLIQLMTEKFKISQERGYHLKISYPIFSYLLADFYISAAKCFLEMEDSYSVEEFVKNVCLFANKDFFEK